MDAAKFYTVNDAKDGKPQYKFSYAAEISILMDGSGERYLKISWKLSSLSIEQFLLA